MLSSIELPDYLMHHIGKLTIWYSQNPLLNSRLNMAGGTDKPRRPDHKFHKKPARSKGNRGKADDKGAVYDGSAMRVGKHGGLVRVS